MKARIMLTQDNDADLNTGLAELRFRGRTQFVPMRLVEGNQVIVTGRWPKIARLNDEEWIDGRPFLRNPDNFIAALHESGLPADVFSFYGELGDNAAKLDFPSEIDNVAAIRTDDFASWWEGLPQEARKNTRRSAKRGVEVRVAAYDDALVAGIKNIYDETPVRQGRKFWHYGKPVDAVYRENASYLDRAEFLGAYLGAELIGFIKYVFVDDSARIMQILCLNAHQDKRPIIALIVKAAERCHQRGAKYLIYGKHTYGKKSDSSITEFKRRLGFEKIELPRYYAPLSLSGRLALKLNAHRSLQELLPASVVSTLLDARAWWLKRSQAEKENE